MEQRYGLTITVEWDQRRKAWLVRWLYRSGAVSRHGWKVAETTAPLDEAAAHQLVDVLAKDLESRLPMW